MNSSIQIADEKLSILYFLSRFDFPVPESVIVDFFSNNHFLNYFLVKQLIQELLDGSYITLETDEGQTDYYHIEEDGLNILKFFSERILPFIKEKADTFAFENRLKIKSLNQILADYTKNADGLFSVSLSLYEEKLPLLSMKLTAATREHAQLLCENWRGLAPEIYNLIINKLSD